MPFNKKPSRKAKFIPQLYVPSGGKPLLDLLEIQRKSFFTFLENGIEHELSKTDVFRETIKSSTFTRELELVLNSETYRLVSPNCTPKEAILNGITYAGKLYVQATLTIRSSIPGSQSDLPIQSNALKDGKDGRHVVRTTRMSDEEMRTSGLGNDEHTFLINEINEQRLSEVDKKVGDEWDASSIDSFTVKESPAQKMHRVKEDAWSELQEEKAGEPRAREINDQIHGSFSKRIDFANVDQRDKHKGANWVEYVNGDKNDLVNGCIPRGEGDKKEQNTKNKEEFTHWGVEKFYPWIFLGELPLMTKRGHFILNGSPRVIVNQIARCPGLYFQEKRRGVGFEQEVRVSADLIPQRGPWLRIQSDWEGRFWARLKREGRVKYATLYEAFQEFEKEYTAPLISLVESSQSNLPKSETLAFQERRAKEERQKKSLVRLFKNPTRYSLGKMGRLRINQRVRPVDFNLLAYQQINDKIVFDSRHSMKEKSLGVDGEIHEMMNSCASPLHPSLHLLCIPWMRCFAMSRTTSQSTASQYEIRSSKKGSGELQEMQSTKGVLSKKLVALDQKSKINDAFTSKGTDETAVSMMKSGDHAHQVPTLSPRTFKENNTNRNLLMASDLDAVHTCLEHLLGGQGFTDDIDHLKNRWVRTSGELLQQQLELGLHRLNEVMTPLLRNLIQGQLSLSSPGFSNPFSKESATSFIDHQVVDSPDSVKESPAIQQKKGGSESEKSSNEYCTAEKGSSHLEEQSLPFDGRSSQPRFIKEFTPFPFEENVLGQKNVHSNDEKIIVEQLSPSTELKSQEDKKVLETGVSSMKSMSTPFIPEDQIVLSRSGILPSPVAPEFPYSANKRSTLLNNWFKESTASPDSPEQYQSEQRYSDRVEESRFQQNKNVNYIHSGLSFGDRNSIYKRKITKEIDKEELINGGSLIFDSVPFQESMKESPDCFALINEIDDSTASKEFASTLHRKEDAQPQPHSIFDHDALHGKIDESSESSIPLMTSIAKDQLKGNHQNRDVKRLKNPTITLSASSSALNQNQKVKETPFRWLRTSKPVNGAFREFFGSNPLSQYMDQTNPLAEITHKRRLSSMGPGGIKRETAGMEVRGIHPTHYGRVCPIETPEGKNAGLVNSPTVFGRIGDDGFMETPLYQVVQGQVQKDRWTFFSAQQEEEEESSLATGDTGLSQFELLPDTPIPVQTASNPLAHFQQVECNRVGYRALSPVQTISIATALIPFLEHDDANRALMGSNMQRQAIPLLLPERPIVGTGFEPMVMVESGQGVQARNMGCVSYVSANKVILHTPTITRASAFLCKSDFFVENFGERIFSSGYVGMSSGSGYPLSLSTGDSPSCSIDSPGYKYESTESNQISSLWKVHDPDALHPRDVFAMNRTASKGFASTLHRKEDAKKDATRSKKMQTNNEIVQQKMQQTLGDRSSRLQLCLTKNAFLLKSVEHLLQIYQRSNQETCLSQRPMVRDGDWVQKGDLVADCAASDSGDLALGKNVVVAYMPWEGYNFEDAIVISDRLIADDLYTSVHIERYEIKVSKNSQGRERITNQIPSLPSRRLNHLDNYGIARVSSWVRPGDILVGKVVELKRPLSPYERLAWELASRLSPNSPEREKWLNKVWLEDVSLRLPPGVCGRVINSQVVSTEWSEKEEKSYPLEVHVYLAVKRKIQVGDKLAGRHGNKGIVSIVLPRQDMPYLGDGTSVDMVLNPLGVPSRMNLGQIFECLLGLAGSHLGCNFKVTPFDEIAGGEASRSLVFLKLYQCRLIYRQQWLFTPTFPGKSKLFDGRTGEPFENWVTVGRAYMLKLIHMVDHKIHARSTGPYSLFTRQPVRGRARRGGQRLGEMEVWAVEGFGAAYTLQEFLTIKSDDLKARAALQRDFYKHNDVTLGKVNISPGNPEAFRVLVSELRALCLHIQM